MKKILILLSVCPVFLVYNLFAVPKTLTLGGKEGWGGIQKADGVVKGKGRFGYSCIELSRNSPSVSDFTDLFLDFENAAMTDSVGNYEISANDLVLTDNCIMGKRAALSRGTGKGMLLSGKRGTMFGGAGRIGSFSIEFWIAPSIAENGERLFSWRSSRTVAGYPIYQTITATFFNNRLEWKFSNVFEGYLKNDGEAVVSGKKIIIPDVWSYHKISYDEEFGLLEYRVDGITEDLKYITSTGREGGDTYRMILGVPADISLCPQYTGRIDDFRIVKALPGEISDDAKEDFVTVRDMYKIDGGRFETEPMRVQQGSVLTSIEAIADVPPQTEVQLYVRGGENKFGWTDSYPQWEHVESGKPVSGIKGGFFQLAVQLYPDGGGRTTPSVTQVILNYDEISPPLPPLFVQAEAGDGSVTLSWDHSADDSAGGYYVYYGERPGEYLGRYALEGASPINTGKVTSLTLTGLKNGVIYYFAVSSWSAYDDRINGMLSKEVFARPKKQ
ncbi:fibronectin type III domain-containing protein [Treponema parvum]|uniref:fibronectin type III domain-containing protein n=1 Tax=Treponema parvum TaxID=138851 RepID=UPI001AEBF80E|nr:fibronectin type III domain-containing protein [Treponema parvum]QTQ15634.1 fibronectin type III domain-containing protein [Treponema parvum]